jgi:hypothetical protein
VFQDLNDDSHSHFPFFLPEDSTMHHPILKPIPPNSLSNMKVRYALVPLKLVTSEGASGKPSWAKNIKLSKIID